jgi:hypothetical protein
MAGATDGHKLRINFEGRPRGPLFAWNGRFRKRVFMRARVSAAEALPITSFRAPSKPARLELQQ